jgi:hypothetical protein
LIDFGDEEAVAMRERLHASVGQPVLDVAPRNKGGRTMRLIDIRIPARLDFHQGNLRNELRVYSYLIKDRPEMAACLQLWADNAEMSAFLTVEQLDQLIEGLLSIRAVNPAPDLGAGKRPRNA